MFTLLEEIFEQSPNKNILSYRLNRQASVKHDMGVFTVLVIVASTEDGYVSVYRDGTFYAVCADNWSRSWSVGLCRYLGADSVLSEIKVMLSHQSGSRYLAVVNSSTYDISHLRFTTTCNVGVDVVCQQASCGLTSAGVQPFIVGGDLAADQAWPWAAVLLYKGAYQCTASVIGNGWLLSAGHCFFDAITRLPLTAVPQYFAVRLGTVLSRGYSRYLRVASVKRIIIHPNYTFITATNKAYNDIALVQLGDDLLTPATTTTGSRVSPVCLADNNLHSLTTLKTWQCYVVGWGLSNVNAERECSYSCR